MATFQKSWKKVQRKVFAVEQPVVETITTHYRTTNDAMRVRMLCAIVDNVLKGILLVQAGLKWDQDTIIYKYLSFGLCVVSHGNGGGRYVFIRL